MTRYFFDNGEIDKLVKQIKSIYGRIYSLNEHCWQQLKATQLGRVPRNPTVNKFIHFLV